jgi:hypothetical protein
MLMIALLAASCSRQPANEAQIVVDTLLEPPTIKPEPGFSAKMLIPPGELYDPLFMLPRGDSVLINDDGKATDGHGGRILAVTPEGKLSVLMDADKLLPVIGFDMAPQGFGNFAGQLFSLAAPTTGLAGVSANHVILRIDLATRTSSTFCTLPPAGSAGKGIAGMGSDARFGPVGSGFANNLYSITSLNRMVYRTLADGTCTPFADLSQLGAPVGLTFTPDGSAMLVTIAADAITSPTTPAKGTIIRMTPDGKVDPKPIATGLIGPSGIAVAPPAFGDYAGDVFVTDVGDSEMPVPQGQRLKRDGKIFRVTKQGELKLVASGFINPGCLRFIRNHLWVTDLNGDFMAGMRELPDGFLVQIDVK